MKSIICLFATMTVVWAQIQVFEEGEGEEKEFIPIIRYDSERDAYGHNYNYGYETGHGIVVEEKGMLKDDTRTVDGFYSYVDKQGNAFELKYVADENGYRPIGDHLPTPPPIPREILEAISKDTGDEEVDENVGQEETLN